MKCAKCGYIRKKNDDHFFPANECPSCGIFCDKNAAAVSDDFLMDAGGSEPVLRPSPVDAETLKKARQRVEKRLKERFAAQKKDSRHDQTLELARRLASEGVRKRQEQWEKQQTALQESDDSQTDPPTESTSTEEATADVQGDATNTGDHASGILNVESESDNTAQKSWFVSSRSEADAALSSAVPDSGPIPDDQPQTNDTLTESDGGRQRGHRQWTPGGGLALLLPLVAWLILLAGISGAILSWTTLTEAEAGMQTRQMGIANSMSVGLLLGFAYLVTGVLGFAFFLVSSLISRQLKDIRQLLLLQSIPQNESTAAQAVTAPEQTQ
jgi:hypothetical protein